MKYKIDGTVMPTVTIELNDGETIYSESGTMVWMSGNIHMKSEMRGGLGAALGRMFAGGSLFIVNYGSSGTGFVTFSNEVPGKIIAMELKAGQEIVVQRDAFLCAEQTATLSTFVTKKVGVGLFGGSGFVMMKVTGPGTAFFTIDGEVDEIELKAGQKLQMHVGSLALLEPQVKFDVTMVQGVTNIAFAGQGLFLANVEGPGTVWMQSMSVATLAERLTRYLPGR